MDNLKFKRFLTFLVILNSLAFATITNAQSGSSSSRKIMEVKSVSLKYDKKDSTQLIVKASGEVNVAGWTKGKLKPRFSLTKPPANGIYKFDFVAIPPASTMNVAQVVSPITSSYTFKTIPANLKKVVVYSENNSVVKKYVAASNH